MDEYLGYDISVNDTVVVKLENKDTYSGRLLKVKNSMVTIQLIKGDEESLVNFNKDKILYVRKERMK